MRPFSSCRGVAAILLFDDVDTDAIIPSREIRQVSRSGLGEGLFANWRYLSHRGREPNPDFILNRPAFRDAQILLAGHNFGCGSSREHAVWALAEYGIRAIVAAGYGRIFEGNCISNGLLPVCLPMQTVRTLAEYVERDPQQNLVEVDLRDCMVRTAAGQEYPFAFDTLHRDMLLQGMDAIDCTLRSEQQIASFRHTDQQRRPWAWHPLRDA